MVLAVELCTVFVKRIGITVITRSVGKKNINTKGPVNILTIVLEGLWAIDSSSLLRCSTLSHDVETLWGGCDAVRDLPQPPAGFSNMRLVSLTLPVNKD